MVKDNDNDFDKDFEEDGEDSLTCNVCGAEEEEDKADEAGWVSIAKMDAIEVLVCTECSTSEAKLKEGFKVFLRELAASRHVRRESMS